MEHLLFFGGGRDIGGGAYLSDWRAKMLTLKDVV